MLVKRLVQRSHNENVESKLDHFISMVKVRIETLRNDNENGNRDVVSMVSIYCTCARGDSLESDVLEVLYGPQKDCSHVV